MRLILKISKDLMLARFRQTLIAAIGVMFSITMFITLVSFMTGLNQLLDGLILNRTPHVLLYNEIEPIDVQPIDKVDAFNDKINHVRSIKPQATRLNIHNSLAIIEHLKTDDKVYGVAPRVTAQVFYNAGTTDLNGVVFGIDVTAESRLFQFTDYVVEGDAIQLDRVENSIVLGKGVADKLMVKIGEVINLTSPAGDRLPLKVSAFYQSGLAELDDVQSYTSLKTAQRILKQPKSYITEIQVKLHDLDLAPEAGRSYKTLFGIDALDIQTANAQFETGSSIRNIITYAVSITLLVVAGFGIYNILNMMIYEKMDSIAILKATGFSGNDVKHIFLSISLIIGISGGIVGLLFGLLGSVFIDGLAFETESLPTISTFPVNHDPMFYLIGMVFSVITTYLSGFFPASKASKLDPVEIIRGK